MTWHRVAGVPGPGDTAVLVDGPGFDFDGLISVEGDEVLIRRRDDENEVQRVKVADLLWLLQEHGTGTSQCEEKLSNDPEDELDAFCDAFREGREFDKRRLFTALQAMGHGLRKNDPKHDQYAICARPGCGHTYERHFDPFDGDREVGCKYCGHYKCRTFVSKAT